MKFRYNYTGEQNEFRRPLMETIFFDEKDNKWKTLEYYFKDFKTLYPEAKTFEKREIIPESVNHEYFQELYNFYEYEIDLDIFYKNPLNTRAFSNWILAVKMNERYRKLTSEIYKIEECKHLSIMDFYGKLGKTETCTELSLFFPDLYEEFCEKREVIADMFITMEFILTMAVNMNKVLSKQIERKAEIRSKYARK